MQDQYYFIIYESKAHTHTHTGKEGERNKPRGPAKLISESKTTKNNLPNTHTHTHTHLPGLVGRFVCCSGSRPSRRSRVPSRRCHPAPIHRFLLADCLCSTAGRSRGETFPLIRLRNSIAAPKLLAFKSQIGAHGHTHARTYTR